MESGADGGEGGKVSVEDMSNPLNHVLTCADQLPSLGLVRLVRRVGMVRVLDLVMW